MPQLERVYKIVYYYFDKEGNKKTWSEPIRKTPDGKIIVHTCYVIDR